jgi:hypothetical protein
MRPDHRCTLPEEHADHESSARGTLNKRLMSIFVAKVEVVLTGVSDSQKAQEELEVVMLDLGFRRQASWFTGRTDMWPGDLENYIKDSLKRRLSFAKHFTVNIRRQQRSVTR